MWDYLSSDNGTKLILGVIALFVGPLAWYFGGRHNFLLNKKKYERDGATADKQADAAVKQADVAEDKAETELTNVARQLGVDSLKSLIEAGKEVKNISDAYNQLSRQVANTDLENVKKFAELEKSHLEKLNELDREHKKEILDLKDFYEGKLREVETKLAEISVLYSATLREISIKDAALAECAGCREEKHRLELEVISLNAKLTEYKRSNAAFLFLWQEAAENEKDPTRKVDRGEVNAAADAIKALLTSAAQQGGTDATAQGEAVAAVAVTSVERFTATAPPDTREGIQG